LSVMAKHANYQTDGSIWAQFAEFTTSGGLWAFFRSLQWFFLCPVQQLSKCSADSVGHGRWDEQRHSTVQTTGGLLDLLEVGDKQRRKRSAFCHSFCIISRSRLLNCQATDQAWRDSRWKIARTDKKLQELRTTTISWICIAMNVTAM
jgi:hypothetical protein